MKQTKKKQKITAQDSAWKDIIEEYFPQFMEFFFYEIYKDIDFTKKYEFLDKEFQKIVKDSNIGKRFADKLVKVYLKDGKEKWLLIHCEIQGKAEKNFSERIYIYNYRIFDRYQEEVISLAILTDDNEKFRPGRYEIKRWDFRHLFEFPVIKLLDYRDRLIELEESNNPFAIVVETHLKIFQVKNDDEKKYNLKLSIARKLYKKKNYSKKDIINLFRFIDWLITLPGNLEIKFNEAIIKLEGEEHMPYISSIERHALKKGEEKGIEKGVEKGIEKGIKKGKKEIAENLLKMGLPVEQISEATKLSIEDIKKLGIKKAK